MNTSKNFNQTINANNNETFYIDNISNDLFNCLKDFIADDLISFVLTGSAGKNSFIVNWSDLDYLIITKNIIEAKKAQEIILYSKKYSIHIGITFISLFEIANNFLSQRCLLSLYEISKGLNKIIYKDPNFNFPSINESLLFHTNEEIAKTIKLIYTSKVTDFRTSFKQIVLLKKLILRLNKTIVYNYDDIDRKFSLLYKNDNFSLVEIFNKRTTLTLNDLSIAMQNFINFLETTTTN